MTTSKYIVLTEDKKEVRFFACGIVNENKTFTGIIHDYVGGGSYQEALVFEDKWIPELDKDGNLVDYDEQIKIFNKISIFTGSDIEGAMGEFIEYDSSDGVQNYIPKAEAVGKFDGRTLIDNMSLHVPYGLGNTIFPDGYEIEETMELNKQKELLEIRYILPGLLTAEKPNNFDDMSKRDKDTWAYGILSEKSDFELVKGTYTLEDENRADRCLQDAHEVYDETPYVEAIASGCGEKLHYATKLWINYSEQLGNPDYRVSIKEFRRLLGRADLITIDDSPYLHTWDFEDDLLISTNYEEDDCLYEINIDEDDILAIFKEGNTYKIVCEDTDYKIALHTLGNL